MNAGVPQHLCWARSSDHVPCTLAEVIGHQTTAYEFFDTRSIPRWDTCFNPRRVRHEYEYCDVCVNRSHDNMLDDCFQGSQRLTSDPTTTPRQCHKEVDNAANRTDQRSARHVGR